ncbi:glutaminyl-peptide cyclotransferase [Pseudomaricurvus sp.]|uniref:glutaminyl-peptide cyclotransferase n=1 Tax=Pseudomaricurvus sp. TaxID=2004510 RepID=UPI003F6C1771
MQFFPKCVYGKLLPTVAFAFVALSLNKCTLQASTDTSHSIHNAANYDYSIIKTLPHSQRSFTQGLVVDGHYLIESSGLYGKSVVHRYPVFNGPASGETDSATPVSDAPVSDRPVSDRLEPDKNEGQYKPLPDDLFAESLTVFNGKLFLLTWKSERVLVLDPNSLNLKSTLAYQGEGWGLTSFGQELVMSNGGDQLLFRDPEDFSINRTLNVTDNQQPVEYLNDLTVAYGLIWANVWHESYIAAIHPDSGQLVGKIELRELTRQHRSFDSDSVLNGIAWDEQQQGFWVTGKRWNKRYLIQLKNPPQPLE